MTDSPNIRDEQRQALVIQAARLARLAREEDLGAGDVTSMLGDGVEAGTFCLVARESGVFAGREIAQTVLDAYEAGLSIRWLTSGVDGACFEGPRQELAEIIGPAGDLLAAERVLLNFLQRLCGIATLTRRYVDAVAGTGALILDTRKTTPGWRLLEKYAVRCGGGKNHRMGLYDAVLVKDNHLAPFPPERTASAVFAMLNKAASLRPAPQFFEVEADMLDQVRQLLGVVGIDVILLDNFSLDDMRRAVELRDSLSPRGHLKLEASGGVNLDSVRGIAETGVDRISVGAITHSATAIDLSLERIA